MEMVAGEKCKVMSAPDGANVCKDLSDYKAQQQPIPLLRVSMTKTKFTSGGSGDDADGTQQRAIVACH
jgi:hypothetical protein